MQSRQAANNWTPSKSSAKINQGLYAFGKSYELFVSSGGGGGEEGKYDKKNV